MAEILKIDSRFPEPSLIAQAAERVRRGEVIAIPTDTFYGLAANPFDEQAVERVFRIKGRARNQPLLLLVNSVEMASGLSANLPGGFYKLARRFWPGPLTIVVEAAASMPPAVTANTGRIGLRLPAAPIAVALIQAAGCPVTATSANLSGTRECSSAQEVLSCLGGGLSMIVDGGISPAQKPSTVLSLEAGSWRILRAGAIPEQEIAATVIRLNQAPDQ